MGKIIYWVANFGQWAGFLLGGQSNLLGKQMPITHAVNLLFTSLWCSADWYPLLASLLPYVFNPLASVCNMHMDGDFYWIYIGTSQLGLFEDPLRIFGGDIRRGARPNTNFSWMCLIFPKTIFLTVNDTKSFKMFEWSHNEYRVKLLFMGSSPTIPHLFEKSFSVKSPVNLRTPYSLNSRDLFLSLIDLLKWQNFFRI